MINRYEFLDNYSENINTKDREDDRDITLLRGVKNRKGVEETGEEKSGRPLLENTVF